MTMQSDFVIVPDDKSCKEAAEKFGNKYVKDADGLILIGTISTIPEPCSILLLALGFSGLLLLRRRGGACPT